MDIVSYHETCGDVFFWLTDEDEELFEDNPEEYIRRDIEGSGKFPFFFFTEFYFGVTVMTTCIEIFKKMMKHSHYKEMILVQDLFPFSGIYLNHALLFLDIDTRRRAACDLVRGLCKFHEQPVIAIFSQYVGAMLQVRWEILIVKGRFLAFVLYSSLLYQTTYR